MRFTTLLGLARDYDLDVPYQDVDKFRSLVLVREGEPLNHQNFLSKFNTLRKFYLNEKVIRRITRETIADAANDNIRYMELRFTPFALTQLHDASMGEAMDWVIEASQEASKEYGMPTGLIASVNRHEDLTLAEEVIQLSIDRMDRGILAVDLAGSEATHPGEEFAPLFQKAKAAGLGITIHAGEWGGAENIAMAIEKLGAERIGHGVRVLEDPAVVKLACDNNVTFEVCPTSNYQSGVVPSVAEHPLPKMFKDCTRVTINTDDPAISQINLSDEYELAIEAFGLDMATVQKSILNAASAAFLPKSEREKLVSSLEAELIAKNGGGD